MCKIGCPAFFITCLLGSFVSAESATFQSKQIESEILLRSEFENQRTVMISANEQQVIWHEKSFEYTTSDWTRIRITNDPIHSVFADGPSIGSPRLDVFQGVFNADNPDILLGTAIVSETMVVRDKLLAKSVESFCETEIQN